MGAKVDARDSKEMYDRIGEVLYELGIDGGYPSKVPAIAGAFYFFN